MNIVTIGSYDEFHEIVLAAAYDRGSEHARTLFRGQSNAAWPLLPSVGRVLQNLVPEVRNEWEERIFRNFKRRAIAYSGGWKPESKWDWLAIAQHHSLPTRLLDWTYSSLSALYFAIAQKTHSDAAVFYHNFGRSISQRDFPDPFGVDKVAKMSPPHISPRISAQLGVFSIHPRPDVPFDHEGLTKIIIPQSLHQNLRKILYAYGTTEASLFPGIDGVAKEIKWAVDFELVLLPHEVIRSDP